MAGIHLNSTVWTGRWLPNYIADVVLSDFPKFYLYIFPFAVLWAKPSWQREGFKFDFCALVDVTLWKDAVSFERAILIGYLKPRSWRAGTGLSGMGCFLKHLQSSFVLDAEEQTPVAQRHVLTYSSAILLHKSSVWEKMRCMEVPRSDSLLKWHGNAWVTKWKRIEEG